MIIVLNRAVRFTLAAELHTQDNTSIILNINTYALIISPGTQIYARVKLQKHYDGRIEYC